MRIKLTFLSLLFVAASITAFAATVHPVQVWCENRQGYTTVFLVFDDNGCLLRASGIDCFGNGWTKEYGVYTGPGSNGGFVPAWIAGLTTSAVQVAAAAAVDVQIVDLTATSLPTVGDVHAVTMPDVPVTLDISTLPVGTYGLLITKEGGTMQMLTFDKR